MKNKKDVGNIFLRVTDAIDRLMEALDNPKLTIFAASCFLASAIIGLLLKLLS